MAKAYNVSQVIPYVLKEDRELPKEQQTIFHVSMVDSALHAHLWDNSSYRQDDDGGKKVIIKAFSLIRDTVKFCVKGWENLDGAAFDEKLHIVSYGNVAGKSRSGLSNIALDLLMPYLSELADAAKIENTISEQDSKNSPSPSV